VGIGSGRAKGVPGVQNLPLEKTEETQGGEAVTDEVKALTAVEACKLDEHEAVIDGGLKPFSEVGSALLAIRDGRLYREHHATFEAYCRERWGMTNRHANRLIESAGVVVNVGPMGPKSERQARPLARLPADEQPAAWEAASSKAKEEARPVTARDVEAEVASRKRPPFKTPEQEEKWYEKEKEKDGKGKMIPSMLAAAIHRLRTEIDLCAAKGWTRCDKDAVRGEIRKLERMIK
jgi:hypothetical protein